MKTLAALLLLICLDSHGEGMGRLFFTPEERAAMEQEKGSGINLPISEAASAADAQIGSGMIRRNGATIWSKGEPEVSPILQTTGRKK